MTVPLTKLLDQVYEALDNAVENGAFKVEELDTIPELSAAAVARDLTDFDADLAKYKPEELETFVQRWMDVKKMPELEEKK